VKDNQRVVRMEATYQETKDHEDGSFSGRMVTRKGVFLPINPDTGAVGPVEPWMADWVKHEGDLSKVAVPEQFVHPWSEAGFEFDPAVDDPNDGFINTEEIWAAIATALSQILGGQDEQR